MSSKASAVSVKKRRSAEASHPPDRTAELIVLGLLVFLSSVVVVPGILGPSMLPKLTAVLVGTVVLVGVLAGRAVLERRVVLPWGRQFAPAGAYAGALLVATATSSNTDLSILGVFERWTGLVPYLSYLVLFVVVVILGPRATLPVQIGPLAALGAIVVYGMLQTFGVDPMDWEDVADVSQDGRLPVFSAFGNVNFASGWTGAVIPLALYGALRSDDRRIRAALLALLAGAGVLLWQAGSAQGPIAGAAGVAFFIGWWATQIDQTSRFAVVRRWLPRLVAVGGLVSVVAVALFVALRPDGGTRQRLHFWDAALAIFVDHPIVGSGLDTYGDLFSSYRSAEGVALYGFERNDAAHSVPLGMLSNGGLVLGLAYLSFVVTVAVVLVRGLRRLQGDDRVRLAAFGGVWLGYQVQSLVSFDVPPVALLHYISAGAIVVLASPAPVTRVLDLSGYRERARRTRRGRAQGPSGLDVVLVGAITVVVLALAVVGTRPLRADLAVGSAGPLLEQNRGPEALERFERGIELAPHEPRYRELLGRLLLVARQEEAAFAAFAEAARLDPGSVDGALAAAELAEALGRAEDARRWYDVAVSRDPHNPAVLEPAVRHALGTGDPERARELAVRMVELRADVDSLLLLGRSATEVGELDQAARAFEQVLVLAPGNEEAEEGLRRLDEVS